VEFDIPARAQLRSAVLSTPLIVEGINKGDLLREFYTDWAKNTVNAVDAIIRGGYYQGLTNTQIARQVFGTAKAEFKDSVWARAQRDVMALTRTAVQHAASQARREVYELNADIVTGVQIVATLDDRTTPLCQSLDGRIFDVGEAPMPPYHIGCRTTTIPVLDPAFAGLSEGATRIARGPDGAELVPADMTYFEWLKTQPAEFQDAAIGPKRGELLRNGGISAERFSELNLDRNFKPRTLEEMRALEPLAFERIEQSKKDLHSGGESGILQDITEGGKYRQLETKDEFLRLAGTQDITSEESRTIWKHGEHNEHGYIQSPDGYKAVNYYARGLTDDIAPEDKLVLDTLNRVTTNNALDDDYLGVRKVKSDYLDNVMGLDNRTNEWQLTTFNNRDKNDTEKMIDKINGLAGQKFKDDGFTSISMSEDLTYEGFDTYSVKFTIQMPEGTRGLVTNNWDESEFIAARGSSLEILGAEYYHPNIGGEIKDNLYHINIFAKLKQGK